MNSTQDTSLLTVAECARRLNCSIGTIYKVIDAGSLRAVKITDKALRVSPDDLALYLLERNGGA